MMLETDGEPASIPVQEAVARNRNHNTLCENPPAHEPRANGDAERAVGEVKAQMRALKIRLEMRIKKEIDVRWPIIEWMVLHSANLYPWLSHERRLQDSTLQSTSQVLQRQ